MRNQLGKFLFLKFLFPFPVFFSYLLFLMIKLKAELLHIQEHILYRSLWFNLWGYTFCSSPGNHNIFLFEFKLCSNSLKWKLTFSLPNCLYNVLLKTLSWRGFSHFILITHHHFLFIYFFLSDSTVQIIKERTGLWSHKDEVQWTIEPLN